ncbi:MAG: hypothetical protein QOH12_1916 [Solirubrobacteraceae bacterium]|nr:hypothetical protein [Solirubrobacteraceae bacterium]
MASSEWSQLNTSGQGGTATLYVMGRATRVRVRITGAGGRPETVGIYRAPLLSSPEGQDRPRTPQRMSAGTRRLAHPGPLPFSIPWRAVTSTTRQRSTR